MEEFKIAVNNFRDKSLRHLWGDWKRALSHGAVTSPEAQYQQNQWVCDDYNAIQTKIQGYLTHTHTHTHFEDPNKGHFPGGQKEWETSVQCLIKCEILLQSLLCSWVLTLNKGQQNVFVECRDVTEKLTFDLLNIKYYHVIILYIRELFCQVFEFLNYGQNLGRSQQLFTF